VEVHEIDWEARLQSHHDAFGGRKPVYRELKKRNKRTRNPLSVSRPSSRTADTGIGKGQGKRNGLMTPKNSCAQIMARNVRFLLHLRVSSFGGYFIYHHS
jgi:hypothetical protein